MPRTKEQFEELRNQKVELIERVAMECFAKEGFHNTSMSAIAKAAGISMGLTYNYFSSKDELLKSIYLKGIKKVFALIKEEPMDKAAFRNFLEHIFKEMEVNTSFWKLYFIVISQPDVLAKYQEYMLETVMPAMGTITQYFKNNGFTEPEIETQMLFSMVDGVCLNYLVDTQHYPLAAIKQKILKYYDQ
jgi:AcrR family transcriptional regulator